MFAFIQLAYFRLLRLREPCSEAGEIVERASPVRFVRRYFKRVSEAFYAALGNARGKGELSRSVDPREEACFFTASVLGLFVMLRAKAPPAVIQSAARVAVEHLEALRAEASA